MSTIPHQLRNLEPDYRVGYCRCGCGERTKSPSRTDVSKGRIKGVPFTWKSGHHTRIPKRYEVDPATGCWNWLIGFNPNGYATIRINNHSYTVYKLLHKLLHGPLLKGLELDHKCRNRRCINPDHLEPVTHTENMRRSPKVCKLTVDKVREIKELLRVGVTHRTIAARFDVEKTAVTSISIGRSWKDVS